MGLSGLIGSDIKQDCTGYILYSTVRSTSAYSRGWDRPAACEVGAYSCRMETSFVGQHCTL